MNTKELVEAIKTALQAATWATSNEKVFAAESVFATAAAPEEVYTAYRSPQAHISVGGMQADPDSHPRLISQEIGVRLVVVNANDGAGEGALLGAHRTANTSRNAGLLEVEEKLMDVMALMQGDEGVNILLRSSTGTKAAMLPDGQYCVVRDYVFTARITTIDSDS